MRRARIATSVLWLALVVPPPLRAQTAQPTTVASPPTVTLEQAIQQATEHYPTVRAAIEEVNASSAGVSVARSAYWPRLDSLWQSNRGTANNVFGQLLPQSVIPA